VDKPGEKPFDLISMSLSIQVTRLIQAWNQRHWIEQMFGCVPPFTHTVV
jgi:hypothetical protein